MRTLRHLTAVPLLAASVVASVVASVACGAKARRVPADAPRAVVAFVNESPDQASVFVSGTSGESFRIASVAPGRTQSITLPPNVFASGNTLTFVARRLASSRAAQSGPVTVRPGDRFTLTLPAAANTIVVLPGTP